MDSLVELFGGQHECLFRFPGPWSSAGYHMYNLSNHRCFRGAFIRAWARYFTGHSIDEPLSMFSEHREVWSTYEGYYYSGSYVKIVVLCRYFITIWYHITSWTLGYLSYPSIINYLFKSGFGSYICIGDLLPNDSTQSYHGNFGGEGVGGYSG
jgi:hypothetical protein